MNLPGSQQLAVLLVTGGTLAQATLIGIDVFERNHNRTVQKRRALQHSPVFILALGTLCWIHPQAAALASDHPLVAILTLVVEAVIVFGLAWRWTLRGLGVGFILWTAPCYIASVLYFIVAH